MFGNRVLWRDEVLRQAREKREQDKMTRSYRITIRKAPSPLPMRIATLFFAAGLALALTLAQAKWNTATWLGCQFSQSYGCYVWLKLYQRGGTE
jgi:hypothetical protein